LDNKKKKEEKIQNSLQNTNEAVAMRHEGNQEAKSWKHRISNLSLCTSAFTTPASKKIMSNNGKTLFQLKIHGGPNPKADTLLTASIADFIHSCGLSF
jgi:hypothetical protein